MCHADNVFSVRDVNCLVYVLFMMCELHVVKALTVVFDVLRRLGCLAVKRLVVCVCYVKCFCIVPSH